MSASGNGGPYKVAIGGVLVIAVIIGARAVLGPRPAPKAVQKSTELVTESDDEPKVRSARTNSRLGNFSASGPARGKARTTETSGTARSRGPIQGFVIENFRKWSHIPEGYAAEGVRVENGALRLVDSTSTSSRVGTMNSPPIGLWQPALSAPAPEHRALPEGCEIRTEISLSNDGQSWGGWIALERQGSPDGKQVQAPPESTWNSTEPPPAPLSSGDGVTSGPYIRYRLTLTSQSSDSPVVEDLRIWRHPRL